jgi:hypothetical protein
MMMLDSMSNQVLASLTSCSMIISRYGHAVLLKATEMKTPSWKNTTISIIYLIVMALLAANRLGSGHELAAILIAGAGIGLPTGYLLVMYGRRWTAQSIAIRVVYIVTITAMLALAKRDGRKLVAILIGVVGIAVPIGYVFFATRKDRWAEKKV